jgi:hypothetical protein
VSHPVHGAIAHSRLTGWACTILRCDTASRPQACVLLILSVLMMLVTILALAVGK